jgi:hypothetical protein
MKKVAKKMKDKPTSSSGKDRKPFSRSQIEAIKKVLK